jgi:GMP synthase PP-ATPase subunit
MTGPDHYREAERILKELGTEQKHLLVAQVHATLALAAATAISGDSADYNDSRAWRLVAVEDRQ